MGSRARPLALLVCLLLLVSGCSKEIDIAPPRPKGSGDGSGAAQDVVQELARWLAGRSDAGVDSLAAPGSGDLLTGLRSNVRDLGITGLSMRFVSEGDTPTRSESAEWGDDAFTATVDLVYRLRGFDRDDVRIETQIILRPHGDEARIVGFGGEEVRTPLWLQQRLSVARTPRTLLAVAGERTGRYPGLVRRALRQVSTVLPRWTGSLVVEVPADQEQLDSALLASPEQYDNIAAVTTTADGSLAPRAPVRIFVNPGVFEGLKRRGAQVVMSHEATHAATDAPFASMPTWLLEGFADYVALKGSGIPLSLAAGQILDRIRKLGLPKHLPSSSDLDPSANGLGATYEEAWLACRFLAQEYGERHLLRFYRAVDSGASSQEAFRSVLNVSQGRFVELWRRDLARLVG